MSNNPTIDYYANWYYNGGGTAPNNCDNEGTELAAAQPAIPVVHTKVSGVSCRCCAICCS